MKHLQSDEVHGLRRILRDQYSFQTIVKELIQNADDSQAGKFHIGWTDNWPQSIHPLLTGPTILILNDGIFRDADAEAIWRVNEPAKGEDLGAIGKYGLGMKSVFHLCEGFFYLASPDQPAADGRDFAELLTPWPRGGPHDDWSDL
ncbi:MAG: hypothetical protein J5J06_15610, partial [Phycisphaerae bacterium]|nr:hypothetical protein [Phycisphaerae bacterium]